MGPLGRRGGIGDGRKGTGTRVRRGIERGNSEARSVVTVSASDVNLQVATWDNVTLIKNYPRMWDQNSNSALRAPPRPASSGRRCNLRPSEQAAPSGRVRGGPVCFLSSDNGTAEKQLG